MSELRDCPFCGKAPKLFHHVQFYDPKTMIIRCGDGDSFARDGETRSEGWRIACCFGQFQNGYPNRDKDGLGRLWNTRATTATEAKEPPLP